MKVINDLLDYNNMKIVQNPQMFSFSLDSVLLPNFITINKNIKSILDIGCGNAPIPLILSTKTSAEITGVEIQKEVYKMSLESVKINKLDKQIHIINSDINDCYKKFPINSFDIITCNPPFFKNLSTSHKNIIEYKKIARHEIYLNLDQLFKIANVLLKNKGNIGIVHRPERLIEIIDKMKKNNIEPKRIQFIYPKENKESNCLLIEGTKNGKPGIKVLPPLYVHKENGEYTEMVKIMFKS